MVKIYCIEDCNGLKYVGSTKRTLKERFNHHKSHKNCSSRKLDLDNCKMYILEETDEEHKQEREQYWIDNTECVNYLNAIQDKHTVKEYRRKWEQTPKRKEYKKAYMKSYRQYRKSWDDLLKIDVDLFR